jgi:hypothetical protein
VRKSEGDKRLPGEIVTLSREEKDRALMPGKQNYDTVTGLVSQDRKAKIEDLEIVLQGYSNKKPNNLEF